jgi:hypothetical protein
MAYNGEKPYHLFFHPYCLVETKGRGIKEAIKKAKEYALLK